MMGAVSILAATVGVTSVPARENDVPVAPRPSTIGFRAAMGANYGVMSTIPNYAGELSLALGKRFGDISRGYFVLHAGRGRTQYGLTRSDFHFGPEFEWPVGPVRIGVELRAGYLVVDSITIYDPRVGGSLGAAARVSVDVAALGRTGALFYAAEARVDSYGEVVAWATDVSFGCRWELTSHVKRP